MSAYTSRRSGRGEQDDRIAHELHIVLKSSELFIRQNRDRRVELEPIAGVSEIHRAQEVRTA